jgi:hypothetical protein
MMKERKSRNNRKKRILAALCTLTLAVGQMSVASAGELADDTPESAFADEAEHVTEATDVEEHGEYIYRDTEELADNEELFAGYVQKMLYPTKTRRKARSAGYGDSRLEGLNQDIYRQLMSKIAAVAAGTETSTIFAVNCTNSWTADELGVDVFTSNYSINPDAKTAAEEKLGFDGGLIIDCLLQDCPYELYWYDKVTGTRYSYGFSYSTKQIGDTSYLTVNSTWKFSFAVAKSYAGNADYTTDPAKTSAVTTAVETAKAIVADNEGRSDYEKLQAYKEKICGLVSYNYDAMKDDYTGGYGDPWQLIYVFDGNPKTDVVCEGYSKAFQYLCDLSTFDNVVCYTVSGSMDGDAHMWNIVKINDINYLVDLTNSDSGSIGLNGGLFLAGPTGGSVENGYTFCAGSTSILYTFREDHKTMYGDILKFAEGNSGVTVTITKQPDNKLVTEGDTSQQTLKVTAKKTEKAQSGDEINYQWYSVGSNGTGTAIIGATSDTYKFTPDGAIGTNRFYCEVSCGSYTRNSLTATVRVAHQESDILYSGSGEKEPTCTEDGVGHVKCTICQNILKDNVTVPKLGHDYGTPEFTWTDSTQASAKFTCQRTGCTDAEAEHEQTVTAAITSETSVPSTCTAKGSALYTAAVSLNGNSYTDTKQITLPLSAHTWASTYTVDVQATETTEGSESIHCSVCGTEKAGSSRTIPVSKKETGGTSSSTQQPSPAEAAGGTAAAKTTPSAGTASAAETVPSAGTASTTPQKKPSTDTAKNQGTTPSEETSQENDTPKTLEKGDVVSDSKKKAEYTVTQIADKKSGTAAYANPTDKNATSISVPKTVKVDGATYKVTSVQTEAFKNCKELKSVTIGSNITTIDNRAFKGCSSLKTITIKSTKLTAKSLSSKAFAGVGKNVVIKVPKSKLKAYTKLFRKKGLSKKVKIIS